MLIGMIHSLLVNTETVLGFWSLYNCMVADVLCSQDSKLPFCCHWGKVPCSDPCKL